MCSPFTVSQYALDNALADTQSVRRELKRAEDEITDLRQKLAEVERQRDLFTQAAARSLRLEEVMRQVGSDILEFANSEAAYHRREVWRNMGYSLLRAVQADLAGKCEVQI